MISYIKSGNCNYYERNIVLVWLEFMEGDKVPGKGRSVGGKDWYIRSEQFFRISTVLIFHNYRKMKIRILPLATSITIASTK